MASNQVEICNAALIKLAQDIPIAAMSDQTKHARTFNRVWDRVLDYVLADHNWSFAMRSVALATLSEDPAPGWGYRYAYPDDCLNALAVCPETGVRLGLTQWSYCSASEFVQWQGGRMDFEVVHGTQNTSIVADLPDAWLIYSCSMRDADGQRLFGRFPPMFVEALACRLAWETAGSIAAEVGLRMRPALLQDYEFAKAKASTHGMNESRDQLQAMTPSQAARL